MKKVALVVIVILIIFSPLYAAGLVNQIVAGVTTFIHHLNLH
jgi:hypothetical protein